MIHHVPEEFVLPNKLYGPECDYCKNPITDTCLTCGTVLILSLIGQFDDGEHVCSVDCPNPDCWSKMDENI